VTAEIATLARAGGRLAIDTEFMSERRYQAMLCLAQIAVPDPQAEGGVRTYVLDPLDENQTFDAAPVAEVLADPGVEITVHAGRQDVAILKRTWRTEFVNIFDTQVAAAFLGYGTQEGYTSLVKRVLDIQLGKEEGYTHWDRRPLTPDQIEYAAADAAHLLELGTRLEGELIEAGRLEWAREECRALEAISDERDPDVLYLRLPKVNRLRAGQQGVARELLEWREQTAREIDRAATSLLPDQVLVEAAKRRPTNRSELDALRGLPPATLHRRHEALLKAIARGADREVPALPRAAPPPDPADAPLAALAHALVRDRSLQTGVAAQLIATQSELARVVGAIRKGRGEPEADVLQGWRRELVGDELLALLRGERSMRVDDHGRLAIEPV
jgi:ribonuclease D